MARLDEDDAKKLALAGGALLGGLAIGAGIAESIRHGFVKVPERPDDPTLLDWGFVVLGVVLSGAAINEAATEFGWKNLVLASAGIGAVAIVARGIRTAVTKE